MRDESDAPALDINDLVRKAQKGDSASFAALYEHFYNKIFRYVSFKSGSPTDAEDITEEVFLRMLESITSFKWKGYPFSSWLFRIAHNLVVDHFRRKGRQRTAPLESVSGTIGATSHDVDSYLDTELSMVQVGEAMTGLTKLQREVLSLRFAGGLSVRETAEAVGKNENAVKALQHAGIKKLRTLLNPSQDESSDAAVAQWSR